MHNSTTILRLFCLIFLFCIGSYSHIQAQELTFSFENTSVCPKYETRAVWLTTLKGLDWPDIKATSPQSISQQQKELCQQLDELQHLGINTIILQTRLRDDVIYPSQLQTWAECLTGTTGKDPGYDPLAFAIEECHKRGMELHAWLVAIPLGDDRQVKKLGRHSTTRKHPELCIHYQRAWYLNPGHPETKNFLAAIVREIVSRYDIDGINFDYIRYPDQPKNFPDRQTYRKYGQGKSLADWRRDNITAIVRHLYQEIKTLKPWVKVSSSPLGKYADVSRYSTSGWNAYNAVFQDAQQWLREGIHDILFPMAYFRGNNYYPFILDWQEHSYNRTIVPGLGIYFLDPKEGNWTLKDIMQEIYFTRAANINGQAYFRTRFLLDKTLGLREALQTRVYTSPALIPPMTWIDSIPPSQPQNIHTEISGDSLTIRWEAATDNSMQTHTVPPMRYNLYASTEKDVNICNAQNLKATYLRDTCYTLPRDEAKDLHFMVTAVDTYGNESQPQPQTDSRQILAYTAVFRDLPKDNNAVQLIVTDLYDRIVWQEPYTQRLNIGRFTYGFYCIKVKDKDGNIRVIDYFTR